MDKYENFIKELINKQLEKHGVDFEYVLKNKEIVGESQYAWINLMWGLRIAPETL